MSTAATLTGLAATGILVVAISPPAAGGEGADIPNPIRTCWETPVFAHRGDTHRYTENTREAVASAFGLGAAVEVDVRTAADGTLLLMHDRRVNRTTNGRGRVEDKTWSQLRRYRTPDGLRIPRLKPVLRMVRDRPSALLMLDLKDLTAGSTRAMIRMVGRFGIRARTPVISFWYPLLNMVRRRDPTLGTSIIAKGREPPAPDAIEPGHGAQVHPRLMTDEWVAAMNDAGIAFTSRIDDTIAAWNRGISVGTNGIVSDDPRAYLRACRRGELPGLAA